MQSLYDKTLDLNINQNWAIEGKELSMQLSVPKNTHAKLLLPKVKHLAVEKNGKAVVDFHRLTPGDYIISGTVFIQ
ncbi:MAG: hypothetical protein GYB33_00530 [Gammaproteobacteria bacterium]|nr:hypothetical protein [Gammaproteobacteria bacterium]